MRYERSKKRGYKNSFYLYIINHIFEEGSLPCVDMSKQSFQYHLNKLILDGIIGRIGYGVWIADIGRFYELRDRKEVKKQARVGKKIRGHGFHWKIDLPNITYWNKREEYLKKNKIEYINASSKANYKAQRILIKRYRVWIHDKSLVVYIPKNKSFYHYTAKDSFGSAIVDIKNILKRFERLFRVNLSINGKYRIKPCKQHYGKIQDSVAKHYNDKGSKIRCVCEGKEWLVIDKSLNQDEIETLHAKTAQKDMDEGIIPFLNDLKGHLDRTGECLTMSGLLLICSKQQENMRLLEDELRRLNSKVNDGIDKRINIY